MNSAGRASYGVVRPIMHADTIPWARLHVTTIFRTLFCKQTPYPYHNTKWVIGIEKSLLGPSLQLWGESKKGKHR